MVVDTAWNSLRKINGLGLRDKTITGTGKNDGISWSDKHLQNSLRSFISQSFSNTLFRGAIVS